MITRRFSWGRGQWAALQLVQSHRTAGCLDLIEAAGAEFAVFGVKRFFAALAGTVPPAATAKIVAAARLENIVRTIAFLPFVCCRRSAARQVCPLGLSTSFGRY